MLRAVVHRGFAAGVSCGPPWLPAERQAAFFLHRVCEAVWAASHPSCVALVTWVWRWASSDGTFGQKLLRLGHGLRKMSHL
jgi:hypothetical protein